MYIHIYIYTDRLYIHKGGSPCLELNVHHYRSRSVPTTSFPPGIGSGSCQRPPSDPRTSGGPAGLIDGLISRRSRNGLVEGSNKSPGWSVDSSVQAVQAVQAVWWWIKFKFILMYVVWVQIKSVIKWCRNMSTLHQQPYIPWFALRDLSGGPGQSVYRPLFWRFGDAYVRGTRLIHMSLKSRLTI